MTLETIINTTVRPVYMFIVASVVFRVFRVYNIDT